MPRCFASQLTEPYAGTHIVEHSLLRLKNVHRSFGFELPCNLENMREGCRFVATPYGFRPPTDDKEATETSLVHPIICHRFTSVLAETHEAEMSPTDLTCARLSTFGNIHPSTDDTHTVVFHKQPICFAYKRQGQTILCDLYYCARIFFFFFFLSFFCNMKQKYTKTTP